MLVLSRLDGVARAESIDYSISIDSAPRFGLLLVLAWICQVSPASATRSAALSWVRAPGAESCIALQELAKRSEQRLAGTTFVAAAEAELNLEGRVARDAGGWVASERVRQSDTSRHARRVAAS